MVIDLTEWLFSLFPTTGDRSHTFISLVAITTQMMSQFEIENAVEVMYSSEETEHTIICTTRERSNRTIGDHCRIDSVIIIAPVVKLWSRHRVRHNRSPVTSVKGRQSALDRHRSQSSIQERDGMRAPSVTGLSISHRLRGVEEKDSRGCWQKETFVTHSVTSPKSGDRTTSSFKVFTMQLGEQTARVGRHQLANEVAPKKEQKSSLILRGVRQARSLTLL